MVSFAGAKGNNCYTGKKTELILFETRQEHMHVLNEVNNQLQNQMPHQ